MGWTKEQREAARQRALARHAKGKDAYLDIASTKGVTNPGEKAELEAIIADLRAKLAVSETQRSEQEAIALQLAEAQGSLMQNEIQEVPTGKTVTVQRLKEYKVVGHKDDGRDILRPVFHDVKLPTFFYKIDMPPVGGNDLKINEVPFYHGAVYTLDLDTLRTVKEMVYRLWAHERSVRGDNENAYRQPTQHRISARA